MSSSDMVDEFERRAKKYSNLTSYHYKKQDYQQALNNFEKALAAEASLMYRRENGKKSISFTAEYGKDEKVEALLFLGSSLFIIIECFFKLNKFEEAAYFTQKVKEISDKLSIYKKHCTAEQLPKVESFNSRLNAIEKALSSLGNFSGEPNSTDPVFLELRKTLNRIYKLELCSLQGDSIDSSCFIATAAYGTSDHTDLDTFRQFRDRRLLPNYFGHKLVAFYYQVSPTLAVLVRANPLLQRSARSALEKLATKMRNDSI
jgi:tetratricopeptide (TPR) repeat protein